MYKSILIILFYSIVNHVYPLNYFGQFSLEKSFFDSIKQVKNGYVIEYLDDCFKITLNRKNARFYRFIYFDNNKRIGLPLILKKHIIEIDGNKSIKDSIVILDGTYRHRDKRGVLFDEEYYDNGKLIYSKSFHKSGKLHEFIDYEAKYQNQEGSYTITIYENYPEPDQIYYCGKVNGKWKLITRFKK